MNNAYINGYLEGYLEKRAEDPEDYNPIPKHVRDTELGREASMPDKFKVKNVFIPYIMTNPASQMLAKRLYAENYPNRPPLKEAPPSVYPRLTSAEYHGIIPPAKKRTAAQEDLARAIKKYDVNRALWSATKAMRDLKSSGYVTDESIRKLKELIAKGLIMANTGGKRNPGV